MYKTFYQKDVSSETVIRHTCDNPPCINPRHLVEGSQADNIADMIDRGRQPDLRGRDNRGSRHSQAQIDEEIAKAIYQAEGMRTEIADQFNTTVNIVESIKRGESWTHVTGAHPAKAGPRRGSRSLQCKVSDETIPDIIAASERGETGRSIAKRHGISPAMVSMIINGKKRALPPA